MVSMIRKQMVRLAFYTTDSELRSDLLRILVAESKPPHWDAFLKARYDGGKKKVPNTNPKTKDRYPQVTMQTLFKSDEGFKKRVMKEYADWISGTKAPSTSKKKLSVTFPPHNVKSSQFMGDRDDIRGLGVKATSIDDVINLAGCGFSFGASSKVSIHGSNITIRGPHIIECDRVLKKDSKTGKPYLYMDILTLEDNAPKGTGTRMFASSVFQAQKLGIQHIRCQAVRDDPEWVGYKVWPKMGYDGILPLEEYGDTDLEGYYCPDLPEKLVKSLAGAGFKAPYKVSHLYLVEGGQEWWEENGQAFHAEFDTTPGSQSMQVFEAYLKKCMDRDGATDLNAWLQGK